MILFHRYSTVKEQYRYQGYLIGMDHLPVFKADTTIPQHLARSLCDVGLIKLALEGRHGFAFVSTLDPRSLQRAMNNQHTVGKGPCVESRIENKRDEAQLRVAQAHRRYSQLQLPPLLR